MKIMYGITICVIILLLACVHSSSNLKTTLKTQTKAQTELEGLFDNLFQTKRIDSCKLMTPEKLLALNPDYGKFSKGKGKFKWLKAWGFDNSAYLFDYLDPVFQNEVVAEMRLLFEKVSKYPQKNPNPKKVVIVNGVKQGTDPEEELGYDPWRDPYDIKHMDSKMAANIDFKVYNISVNVPQVNQAFKEWGWPKPPMASNPGKQLVFDHDFNNDGRLSVREFIIAIIRNNAKWFGMPECKMCFNEVMKKFDAIFSYIDCDNNGLITSEDIYHGMKTLKREKKMWNFYTLANQARIRTAVTNDFVLKSMENINGALTKEEFRKGLLLGFWDRQTTDEKVWDHDEKNLKHLRWKGNMIDITAARYIKAKQMAQKRKIDELQHRGDIVEKGVSGPLTTNDVFDVTS